MSGIFIGLVVAVGLFCLFGTISALAAGLDFEARTRVGKLCGVVVAFVLWPVLFVAAGQGDGWLSTKADDVMSKLFDWCEAR